MTLQALLTRVEAATRPDREIDGPLYCLSDPVIAQCWPHWTSEQRESLTPPYTASLDAALELVEQQNGSGIDAAQMLHEALEDMANGGWRDDQPIGPQIARYLLAALLKALIAQEAA